MSSSYYSNARYDTTPVSNTNYGASGSETESNSNHGGSGSSSGTESYSNHGSSGSGSSHNDVVNDSNNDILKQLESPNSDWGNAIEVDEEGNIFFAGATYGNMIDQTYNFTTHTITDNLIENDDSSGNTTDAYISRMTIGERGMISWTKLIGTRTDNDKFKNDEITAIDRNEGGDIFAALRSEWNSGSYQKYSESKIVKYASDGSGETFYSIGEKHFLVKYPY